MSSKAPSHPRSLDVEALSDQQLEELQHRVEAEVKKRAAKRRRSKEKEIIETAKLEGIDLAILAGRASDAPKYRDPDNQFNVWSGRGRQPEWVKKALARGLKLDDLKV